MSQNKRCPKCNPTDVFFSKKKNQYICEDCQHVFKVESERRLRRIFISYGHDQHAHLAQRLRNDLEEKDHQVWFDLDRLKPGADWESYIEEGLNWVTEEANRGCVLLLMTPHSIRRPDGYCLNEITKALDRRLPIVPVMVVWCEPPLSIIRIQWLDMQDCLPLPQKEERYEERLDRLLEALETDHLDYEGSQSRLIRLLEPLPFDADIAQHLKRFTGRDWVFERIDQWLADANSSRVFWISGSPGVGKTAIAAWLCYHRREVAAFHLCRHGHVQKSDPRRAVLSIAYQLSSQLSEYHDRLNALQLERIIPETEDARTLFDMCIVQPLSTNFPIPDRTILIVIDALDEASEGGRNELANFIASEFSKTPPWLRLIITSRPDPEVVYPLQALTPYILEASSQENITDLRSYLHKEIKIFSGENSVSDAVIEEIIARSEGLFLYADWVRDELQQGRLSLKRIHEFPQGLGGVYAQFIRRQFPDLAIYEEKIRPGLEIIVAAQDALDLNLLSKILNWQAYDHSKFIHSLGSIFQIVAGCIRPFHRSISEWLTDAARAGDYFVSHDEGHRRLAEFSWKEYQEGVSKLSSYSIAHLPYHLCRAERWADLEMILTDLLFIEAKCAAGLTYDLIKDYNLVLDSLPEAQAEKQVKIERQKRLDQYVKDLIAYSKGELDKLEVIPSIEPWSEDKIKKEMERILKYPTTLEKIKTYYTFISNQSHHLINFSAYKNFTIQQAFNHVSNSSVVQNAKNILISKKKVEHTFHLLDNYKPKYNPYPNLMHLLNGHFESIETIVLSLDKRIAVTGSKDTNIHIWDLENGRCIKIYKDHNYSIQALCISANRQILLSGDSHGNLFIFDLNNRKKIASLEGHGNSINSVNMTPDGKIGISGDTDGITKVWDLSSGNCLNVLRGHTKSIHSVAISVNGLFAVTGSLDNRIRVWDLFDGHCIKTINCHYHFLKTLMLQTNSDKIISGGMDCTIRIWNIKTGELLNVYHGHTDAVDTVCLSADGNLALSGSRDNTIRVWNLNSNKCIRIIKGHSWRVLKAVLSIDGSIAVSAEKSLNNDAYVWNIESGYSHYDDVKHEKMITSLRFSNNGKSIVSSSWDKTLKIWKVENKSNIKTLKGHLLWIEDIAFSPDGKFLVSGGEDKSLYIWDIKTGNIIKKISGHQSRITSIKFLKNGKYIVTGARDSLIIIWDIEKGINFVTYKGHSDFVESLALSADDNLIFSGGGIYDKNIHYWEIRTGQIIKTLKGHKNKVKCLTISPDGLYLISASWDSTIRIWDIKTGECIQIINDHNWRVNAVEITADGQYLVSGSADKTIRVFDFKTGECLGIFAHQYGISTIAIRNNIIAAGDFMGNIMVFDNKNLIANKPTITLSYLYNFHNKKHTKNPNAICKWCGDIFAPPNDFINKVRKFSFNYESQNQSLFTELFDDLGLISECPKCHEPLKFNPFIVDNRELFQ